MMLTALMSTVNIINGLGGVGPQGGSSLGDLFRISRRQLLASGGKAAAVAAAVGIAPRFIRPSRAFAADALAPGMIGGPTGFDGAERYQYGPDTPEGRAIEAA